jgi:hypothetical protein
MGNAKSTKRMWGMFTIKYILIFIDEKYPFDLGKRWEGWQNIEKVGGTSYYPLTKPNKGKWTIMYKKTLKNEYIRFMSGTFYYRCDEDNERIYYHLWRRFATLNQFADKLINKIWQINITIHLEKHNNMSCELSKALHALSIRCCFSYYNEIKKVNNRHNNPICIQYPTICGIHNHEMLYYLE